MDAESFRLCLQYRSGQHVKTPRVIELKGDEVTLGRSRKQADVVVDIPIAEGFVISRKHATLRRRCDGWTLRDAGSINGVAVNGERLIVGSERFLREGDLVCLGGATKFGLVYCFERSCAKKKRRRIDEREVSFYERVTTALLAAAEAMSAATAAASKAKSSLGAAVDSPRRRRALAQLRCPPCGEPFACACVLACGHSIDEACLIAHLEKSGERQSRCPMCESVIRPGEPHRSPHLDAAASALVVDLEKYQSRINHTLCLRKRMENACTNPVVRALLFGSTSAPNEDGANECGVSSYPGDSRPRLFQRDKKDEDDHDGEPLCDGCGEYGHLHAECPHRSDISDSEESSDEVYFH